METTKMQLGKIFGLFALVLFISSCATNFGSSQSQDFGRYLSVEEGVSSKVDIFDSFGQPGDVNYFENSESVWVYYAVSLTTSGATYIPVVGLFAGGSNSNTQISKFYFDSNNIVLKVETSSKTQYVNQWVGLGTALSANDYAQRIENEMAKLELPYDQFKALEIKGVHSIVD
tara:strand:+ start:859 stop:1377 length:519 start_codon:yes stop_codon:yes gene_type:complete